MRLLIWIVIAQAAFVARGAEIERGRVVDAGTFAYYAPSHYDANARWPVIYVFDPLARGATAAEFFREAAEEFGWIVIASNVTRNGMNWDVIGPAVADSSRAASRMFALDSRRVYTSGFSGGAMIAVWVARRTNAIAGVIACGSPPVETANITFDWFGTTGDLDFNNAPSRAIDASIPTAHRLDILDGGHRWASPEELRVAFAWMELQAMNRGTRARDEELIARTLKSDLAFAELGRDALQKLRRYEAIARTYDGLRSVDVREKIDALKPAAVKLAKEEKAADKFEESFIPRQRRVFDEFLHGETLRPAVWLANELQITHLRKVAAESTYRGLAAQRALARMRGELRRLAEELEEKKQKALADVVRDVLQKAAV
ncbi:MAG TPA: hypothetical protein VMU84_08645 [Thermoanaerobaculia bacterium]|nr:hypothetical protein [Thermoanaerobaculia bacterium]